MKCPVCNKELDDNINECIECGFDQLHEEFLNESDYNNWLKETVLPCRSIYENLSDSYDSLSDCYGCLEEDYDDLKSKYEDLELDYDMLKSKYSELKKENERLIDVVLHKLSI